MWHRSHPHTAPTSLSWKSSGKLAGVCWPFPYRRQWLPHSSAHFSSPASEHELAEELPVTRWLQLFCNWQTLKSLIITNNGSTSSIPHLSRQSGWAFHVSWKASSGITHKENPALWPCPAPSSSVPKGRFQEKIRSCQKPNSLFFWCGFFNLLLILAERWAFLREKLTANGRRLGGSPWSCEIAVGPAMKTRQSCLPKSPRQGFLGYITSCCIVRGAAQWKKSLEWCDNHGLWQQWTGGCIRMNQVTWKKLSHCPVPVSSSMKWRGFFLKNPLCFGPLLVMWALVDQI